jgi:heme exporter protein D
MGPDLMLHLETGKYAFFVWTAYGLTAVVFAVLTAASLSHARRWRKRAEALGRK